MTPDDGPIPQFTATPRRRWLGRKKRQGGDSASASLANATADGLFELLFRLIAGLFEHHH